MRIKNVKLNPDLIYKPLISWAEIFPVLTFFTMVVAGLVVLYPGSCASCGLN